MMFRQLAASLGSPTDLFLYHPSELAAMLEVAWQKRVTTGSDIGLGLPTNRSNVTSVPDYWLEPLRGVAEIERLTDSSWWSFVLTAPTAIVTWRHLIYAYMIENTRVYEIFRRVVHEFLHGEKLGAPLPAAQLWLRNTEELFYNDPPPLSITNITSHIRSDLRSTRRNAYWRMFGMDLTHGSEGGQPYSYSKAEAHNKEFVNTFEEFLREAWIAIANLENTSGPNPTDRPKLENIAKKLQQMLLTRRTNGNLSREEFVSVSAMSWFHLTLLHSSPIIQSLRAEAASPEQRLFKVAERVDLPALALSHSYFEIADSISYILIKIESATFNSLPSADPLFNTEQRTALSSVITHWSIITGRDMKARKVAAT